MFRSTTQSALMALGIAWFTAQAIKATIMQLRKPKTNWFYTFLWRTGGMPSSHSALVTALASYVAFTEGVDSLIFAITLGFAGVTVRDSLGIRRMVGKLIERLNTLEANLEENKKEEYKKLKEVRGHEPSEVIAGVALGLLVGVVFGVIVR